MVRAEERLTVVVLVDGMNDDDLRLMRPYWPQGGLRTLSEEAYQTTVGYPHAVYGGDETTATLMTGTTPAEHGICMNRYFKNDILFFLIFIYYIIYSFFYHIN